MNAYPARPTARTAATTTPTPIQTLRLPESDMCHTPFAAWLWKRRRVEHGHHFLHHRLARRKAGGLVTTQRVEQHVGQAAIAVGTRSRCAIEPGSEEFDQVVVGNERPRNAHRVTVAIGDRRAYDRRRLEPTGADDWHADGL